MHIFEIVKPGMQLNAIGSTPRSTWDMESMLDSLQSLFFEATLALNLFEQSMNAPDPDPTLEQYNRRMNRMREIQQIVEEERGPSTDFFRTDIRLEAEARLKREEWDTGRIPVEFEHRVSFIYAKAFISSLDGFERLLGVIASTEGAPQQPLAELHAQMRHAFPDLRGVRNSSQHHEDRVRSLGNRGKPLDLKPITDGMVPPELPVLALNNIHGSKYCTTMEGGEYGEVDITPDSMRLLRDILQGVINAFAWSGPSCHLPGYARLK
jgi:hypothetical protein